MVSIVTKDQGWVVTLDARASDDRDALPSCPDRTPSLQITFVAKRHWGRSWQAGGPTCQGFRDQKWNTIPADGCAVWVTVLVLRVVRPKSGAL